MRVGGSWALTTQVSSEVSPEERVRKMQVRFVREDDPINQALLEIYVHLTLGTRYNDFDNH